MSYIENKLTSKKINNSDIKLLNKMASDSFIKLWGNVPLIQVKPYFRMKEKW